MALRSGFLPQLLGIMAALATWSGGDTVASAGQIFSFLLENTPHATNPELGSLAAASSTIFAYDTDSKLAVVSSTRLATALAPYGVTADALSFGHDRGTERNPDSHFLFSIELRADGKTAGISKSAVASEPASEAEADIFWVKDRPTTSRAAGSNSKAMDENQSQKLAGSPLSGKQLGLTGTIGTPRNTAPMVSNVEGFDVHGPTVAGSSDIYFSIDAPVASQGWSPADLLKLDTAGTITVYRTAASLGLDPDGDDIDALGLNIHGLLAERQGWYSLTRTSVSLGSTYSAGDIFRFFDAFTYSSLGTQLHMTAESIGLSFSSAAVSGDIDSIAHDDPNDYHCGGPGLGAVGDTIQTGTFGNPDEFSIRVDGHPWAARQGSAKSVDYPFQPGDVRVVDLVGSAGGHRFAGRERIVIGPTFPEVVSDLEASVTGLDATWSWTLPSPNPFTAIEAHLDRTIPVSLAATATSYSVTDLTPGVHSLAVRGRVGSSRGGPVEADAEIVVDLDLLQPPDELAISASGRSLTLDWTNPMGYDSAEILIDDAIGVTVSGPLLSGDPASATVVVDYGLHRVAVRGVVGASVTHAIENDIAVPVPVAGTLLRSAPTVGIAPVGITVLGPSVYVADAVAGGAHAHDLLDLGAPFFVPAPVPGEIRALATAGSSLVWIIDDEIYTTDGFGGGAALEGSLLASGSPLVTDAASDGADLWIADAAGATVRHTTLSGIDLAESFAIAGSATLSSVAWRGSILDIAHGSSAIERVTTVDSTTGSLRRSLPTAGLADDLRGLAFVETGSADVASWFAIDPASATILEIAAVDPVPLPGRIDCHQLPGAVSVGDTPALPIDDLSEVSVTTTVTDPGTVVDVDVRLSVTHEFVGDLELTLESPSGTVVTLFDRSPSDVPGLDRRIDGAPPDEPEGSFDGFGPKPAHGPGRLSDFDGETAAGGWTLTIIDHEPMHVGTLDGYEISICVDRATTGSTFRRGDANSNGGFDISDAVFILNALFGGGITPSCRDAADANDDGGMNIADAIVLLSYLFGLGPPPPPPHSSCGVDSTLDTLDCGSYPCP
ncbi:MAG: proprotein convertase P-domain-containing protein [Planctomycetes bacterium]|nr:proprotein convertase P-domain-containing protein [Planctomycetota bacterium]